MQGQVVALLILCHALGTVERSLDCAKLFPRVPMSFMTTNARELHMKPTMVDFEPQENDWDVATLKNREQFIEVLRKQPAVTVLTDTPYHISITSADFLAKMSTGARIMTFDRQLDFMQSNNGKPLVKVPKHLIQQWPQEIVMGPPEYNNKQSAWWSYLSYGSIGSGSQFHQHGPSFLSLIKGRKVWYLYPPGGFPQANSSALHLGIVDWVASELPQLTDGARPTVCVQHAGETLFLPDSWTHATSNYDNDTLAVAIQTPFHLEKFSGCEGNLRDIFCFQRLFEQENLADFPKHWREIEQVSADGPWMFISALGAYAKDDKLAAKELFLLFAESILRRLREVPHDSKQANMLSMMTLHFGRAVEVSAEDWSHDVHNKTIDLLTLASEKAPRSGIGTGLMTLIKEISECLLSQSETAEDSLRKDLEQQMQLNHNRLVAAAQRHLEHFPGHPFAEEVLETARAELNKKEVPRKRVRESKADL